MIRLPAVVVIITALASSALAQPAGAPPPPPPDDGQSVVPIPTEDPPPVDPPPVDPVPVPQPQVQAPPAVMPAPPDPEPSDEERAAMSDYAPVTVRAGGYLQTQYRLRENSPVGESIDDTNGFRFARIRPMLFGSTYVGNLDVRGTLEMELDGDVSLVDAYTTIRRSLPDKGFIAIDIGQVRTPISRMQLLDDSNQAFVEKAQIATIAHDRDIGLRLAFQPPKLAQVRIWGGVFNGEGINQLANSNESFLWAARLELSPVGEGDPLVDSIFGGRFLTLGMSIGRNKLSVGGTHDIVEYRGIDLTGRWKGLSGSVEYLDVAHSAPAYHANGFAAQLAYALPFKAPPFKRGRLEIGARIEEIDRNDTVRILAPGEPNQSQRITTGVISYYLRGHGLKVQLAYNHVTELENETLTMQNATYDNNQLVLQLTYRLD